MENIENNYEVAQSPRSMKTFFKSWQFWRPFLGVLIGGLAGFMYYYFIGCTSGKCAITSNPYMSVIWGGLMGLFITSSPCSRGKC
jgi:hypothetical protein